MRPLRQNAGLTLPELLVALAIFIVVITGVVSLYSGAVETVRSGQRAVLGTETARSVLDAIERDLTRALAARDYGDNLQFYGRPEGFMFVGVTDSGQPARITYVFSRLDRANDYRTTIVQPLDLLMRRVLAQEGPAKSRRAVTHLANIGQLSAGQANAVFQALDAFANNVQAGFVLPQALQELTIELEVTMRNTYLMRFEEPGVTDLESFTLPGNLEWPEIDPFDPDFDVFERGSIEQPGASNQALYEAWFLPALTSAIGVDMRTALANARESIQAYPPPRFITNEFVSGIVAAKKREIWIRMLANDPELVTPAAVGDTQGQFDTSRVALPNFWLETGRDPKDFVVAEQILDEAALVLSEGVGEDRIDIFNRPGFLLYGTGDEQFRKFYNALETLDGYERVFLRGNPAVEVAGLFPGAVGSFSPFSQFDMLLAEQQRGRDILLADQFRNVSASPVGSLLGARMPEMLKIRFWIASGGPGFDEEDFTRWFDQTIEVPTADSRNLPSTFVANDQTGLGG